MVKVLAVLTAVLCVFGCEEPVPRVEPDARGGLLMRAIDRSVHKVSTGVNDFVLVSVIDGDTHKVSQAAVAVQTLLPGLGKEHGLSSSQAVEYVRKNPDGEYEFSDPAVLQQLLPPYSEEELNAIRVLLADLSPDEIVQQQNALDSRVNVLSKEKYGQPYGFMRIVLHVLLERGVLCGASCKPGLVYLVE